MFCTPPPPIPHSTPTPRKRWQSKKTVWRTALESRVGSLAEGSYLQKGDVPLSHLGVDVTDSSVIIVMEVVVYKIKTWKQELLAVIQEYILNYSIQFQGFKATWAYYIKTIYVNIDPDRVHIYICSTLCCSEDCI